MSTLIRTEVEAATDLRAAVGGPVARRRLALVRAGSLPRRAVPRPVGDLVAGLLAGAVAAYAVAVPALTGPSGSTGTVGAGVAVAAVAAAALAGAAVWLAALAAAGAYRPATTSTGATAPDLLVVVRAGLVTVVGVAAASYATSLAVPRLPLLALVVGAVALTCAERMVLARLAPTGAWRVVVAAHHGDVAALTHRLEQGTGRPVQVVALTDAADRTGVVSCVAAHDADALVLAPCEHFDATTLRAIGWDLESLGARFLVSTGLDDVARHRTAPDAVGSLGLLHVRPAARSGPGGVVKGCWERAAAALALLVASPVLVLLMLLIRLESPGPALFRQTRVGRDHQTFTMLKLRTMRADADRLKVDLDAQNECDGVLFKMRRDPRVTRVGRVLRRYSLDEVPQLVNVVMGHMSLVGPRPPLPQEVARYADDVGRRLVVKPGLTGLWQVSGRSDLSWDESVRLDLSYVDNWSLGLDAAIVGRTVKAVLAHDGAY